jgi:hypothetical protein
MIDLEFIAEKIHESLRLEASWSNRSVVFKPWDQLDEALRSRVVNLIWEYLQCETLPTPREAHDSFVQTALQMGWRYGEKLDVVEKTHPGLVPFDQLPKDERDIGAILQALVWLVKQLKERFDTSPRIDLEFIAEKIYEAARLEASWSNRSIVPELWDQRDEAFRRQFVNVISEYFRRETLPTPQEAHDSWMQSYLQMGWRYGEKRDPVAKTHPDLVPFDQLPKDERDKDAIFLAFVWLAKQLKKRFGLPSRKRRSGDA